MTESREGEEKRRERLNQENGEEVIRENRGKLKTAGFFQLRLMTFNALSLYIS